MSSQKSYPGVELKRHPDANIEMVLEGLSDRYMQIESDFSLTEEIIETYQNLKKLGTLCNPSGEWEWILANGGNDYATALESGNRNALMELLRNMFRNELTFGLISLGTYDSLIHGSENDKINFSNSILLDVDTWKEFCECASIDCLSVPLVGNPFGIFHGNSLIIPDTYRHYYHARRLNDLISSKVRRNTILEIGGGYGGVFWRLLEMIDKGSSICYINCDLHEKLFVFYYFVMSCCAARSLAVPRTKWAVDGVVTAEDTKEFELILVPSSRHDRINCSLDIVYNANSLSEMSRHDVFRYFGTIERNAPKYIFHQNSNYFPWKESSRGHLEILARDFPINPRKYREIYRAISPWMGAHGRYREFLYKERGICAGD